MHASEFNQKYVKSEPNTATWQIELLTFDIESAPRAARFDKISGTKNIGRATCARNRDARKNSNLIIIDFKMHLLKYSFDFFMIFKYHERKLKLHLNNCILKSIMIKL